MLHFCCILPAFFHRHLGTKACLSCLSCRLSFLLFVLSTHQRRGKSNAGPQNVKRVSCSHVFLSVCLHAYLIASLALLCPWHGLLSISHNSSLILRDSSFASQTADRDGRHKRANNGIKDVPMHGSYRRKAITIRPYQDHTKDLVQSQALPDRNRARQFLRQWCFGGRPRDYGNCRTRFLRPKN